MMSLPNSASSRLLPERNPSPTPTSSNRDPTPHAMPNIVRNERSLCAHRFLKICPKISITVRISRPTLECQTAPTHYQDAERRLSITALKKRIRPFFQSDAENSTRDPDPRP